MIGTKWEIGRDTNPWDQTGITLESNTLKAGDTTLLHGFECLKKFDSPDILLGLDKNNKKIIINEKYFSTLRIASGTVLAPADQQIIGQYFDVGFQRLTTGQLAAFLIESHIIITYVHIGSTLEATRVYETNNAYIVRVEGEHEYYTNQRNTAKVDFSITIDKTTGMIYLKPGWPLSEVPTEPELKK